MRAILWVLAASLAAAWLQMVPRVAAADGPKDDDVQAKLLRRATVIKPTPAELKWQKIPWILDLAEGQLLAQAEGRPIFLWVSGDAPLERC